MEQQAYVELCKDPIRFNAVSQLNNVFFDDTNKQIFSVRSGGETGVVVKGPKEEEVSFCMSDRGGTIRSIKFSTNNQVLAVQRRESAVEFICFECGQPRLDRLITHQVKALVYGFVWLHGTDNHCALIANTGIEILAVLPEKRQVRSVKALSMNIRWFAWCPEASLLLCAIEANETVALTPVLVKQKTITKLAKLDLIPGHRDVQESKITLAQVYGTMTVLILQAGAGVDMMEVEVFLLNGPGLAPRLCHVLRLGLIGRFAINTVDNLIVVHHQASATSLLFDIALSGDTINGVTYHTPITPGRSMRPFSLKLPGLALEEKTLQCELYSTNWVLFQPNIVIDAQLGCMWYLNLCIEPLCVILTDRVRLTEFLLQRSNGKQALLKMLGQLVDEQYTGKNLPLLDTIFNQINKVYASWVHLELQNQTAQPSNVKSMPKQTHTPPKVLIEQEHMYTHVLKPLDGKPQAEIILMLYLQSLSQHRISAQEDFSRMIITELIANRSFDTLRRLVSYSLLLESKKIACFLLENSHVNTAIAQVALDMLGKIKANEIIIEVLLGQGRVMEALRLARNISGESGGDTSAATAAISARKFLEAARNAKDDLLFHSVFRFFQMRNMRQRGSEDFLKSEQCGDFVQYYNRLCSSSENAA